MLGRTIAALGPLLALLLIVALVSWIEAMRVPADDRVFLTLDNFLRILRQNVPVGIIAIGMTFVIISGGIDLSVGAITLLAGGLGLMVMQRVGGGDPASMTGAIAGGLAMLVCGAMLGAVNGVLVSVGRLAPFIATLATLAAFRSVAQAITEGGDFRAANDLWTDMGYGGVQVGNHNLPYLVIAFLVAAAIGGLLLRTSIFGLRVRAVGDNTQAARYAGTPVKRTLFWTYVLSGLTAGIGAVAVSSRMGAIVPNTTGMLYELDAIAAVVIGGTRMQGGYGRIWGTVVGVVILGVISNMLVMLGVNVYYQGLVKGAVIVVAVLVQRK
jgi:ribose transport system permease protein